VLQKTLDEKATDKKVTTLAESKVNLPPLFFGLQDDLSKQNTLMPG
jgi:hypothetical protein